MIVPYAYRPNFTDLPFSFILQSSLPAALYFFSVLLFTVNRARFTLSLSGTMSTFPKHRKLFFLNTRMQLDCYFTCVCLCALTSGPLWGSACVLSWPCGEGVTSNSMPSSPKHGKNIYFVLNTRTQRSWLLFYMRWCVCLSVCLFVYGLLSDSNKD